MIHLLTAQLFKETAEERGVEFFVGSLAPDAMHYPEKEHLHLRCVADRAAAMANLARNTDPEDDFAEGVLLHLYTDWQWDQTHLQNFRNSADKSDKQWFKHYQRETGLASSWFYWNNPWAARLWEDMLALPTERYGKMDGIAPEHIRALLVNAHRWLSENQVGPSAFYPPEVVDQFAQETASNYQTWRPK